MSEFLLVAAGGCLLLLASRARLGRAFILVLLTTEFLHLDFGGGYGRLYHPMAALVIVLKAKHLPRLVRSPLALALAAFLLVNVAAVLLSDSPERAAASLLGFMANMSIAVAIALLMLSGSLRLSEVQGLLASVTVAAVLWGLFQIGAFRVLGINLGLSVEQTVQVAIGFGPGFRTEANTFGKYMVVPFLLLLPEYLEGGAAKWRWGYFVLFLVGVLMNFTRSAVFGLSLAAAFVVYWYWRIGRLGMATRRGAGLVAPLSIGVLLLLGGYFGVSEYAQYKAQNLFNREELIQGGSSGYRLMMMQAVISRALSDTKTLVLGNGWGQTYVYHQGVDIQAGGGDAISILGYSGLIGVAGYLIYMFVAGREAIRVSFRRPNRDTALVTRGALFALVGVFFTATVSGYLIAPEYWLLLGLVLHLGVWSRESDAAARSKAA